jgi:hypothetical protein
MRNMMHLNGQVAPDGPAQGVASFKRASLVTMSAVASCVCGIADGRALGGCEVDNQVELGRLFGRAITGLRPA